MVETRNRWILNKLLNYLNSQNDSTVRYLPKYNSKFCAHHHLKDIDIFFITPSLIKYSAHANSKDLLICFIMSDYCKFSGTELTAEGFLLDPNNVKLPPREWFNIFLKCDAVSAENHIRYINWNEAQHELNRHRCS
jgi:hypothetical protein